MKNKIYKIISIITIFALVTGCSSNSDTPSISNTDYMEISMNGKSYKEDIVYGGTGMGGQTGCVTKPFFRQLLSHFEDSSLSFDSSLFHLENDADFKNSIPGVYSVKQEDYTSTSTCNLDLELSLEDKTQSIKTTRLITGGNNKITSIKKGNSTSTATEYEYIITGNFTASFKNNSNAIIPVSGKYQITIFVYK
jgi:hypothetical protein